MSAGPVLKRGELLLRRGGSRCKSDGCQRHAGGKATSGEAPEEHGGPGAPPPENFLGSTPFKFAEHMMTPFIFPQISNFS